MNKEEFCEQIKPHVEKYIDGFYDEKFEGANIRQILNIAEQYAKSNVSKQLAEKDAEIERLKELIVSAKPPQITQQLAANPYQCTPNICAKRTTGGCDLGKCIMDLTNEA